MVCDVGVQGVAPDEVGATGMVALCRRDDRTGRLSNVHSFSRKKNEPRKAPVGENSANRYSNTLIIANSFHSNMLYSGILIREGFQHPLNFQ